MNVQKFCNYLDEGNPVHILDVRSEEEIEEKGEIKNAQHIHVTQLPEKFSKIPRENPLYIFCGSGLRSMVAASFLRRKGWKDVSVILGGTKGWGSARCPFQEANNSKYSN